MGNELFKRILSSIIIIPIVLFFLYLGSEFFILFLFIILLATLNEWLKMNKKNNFVNILGIIFLLLSFYSVYLFRNDFGFNIILFVILICIFTDLGGYFFGKIFKGPKLTKISPNKTYSGVLGSFIISFVGLIIFINYQHSFYQYSINEIHNNLEFSSIGYNFKTSLVVLLISFISQIGDLIVSYFKRKAKIKDTGKILPGHGGLLDRIDGMIFAFPFSYIIFSMEILK